MRTHLQPSDLPIEWKRVLDWIPTGSSFICDPPVTDTDRDFVVLTDDLNAVRGSLLLNGWTDCGADARDACQITQLAPEHPMFIARKGELNIVFVVTQESFEMWRISTVLAKRFNLREKIDRQDLFSAIRDRYLVSEQETV